MELLIVIGVLGILAAGLLAAIDPFEQLKKARDTNNRSAAIELLGASQRYYSTHGYLPWFKKIGDVYDTATCADAPWDILRPDTPTVTYPRSVVTVTPDTIATDPVGLCLDETLGTDGEIKTTFFSGLRTPVYILSGSATNVAICFPPEGKSNRSDDQTMYSIDSVTTPTAVSDTCTATQRDAGECLQCFE